jgi:hypothetical protein
MVELDGNKNKLFAVLLKTLLSAHLALKKVLQIAADCSA